MPIEHAPEVLQVLLALKRAAELEMGNHGTSPHWHEYIQAMHVLEDWSSRPSAVLQTPDDKPTDWQIGWEACAKTIREAGLPAGWGLTENGQLRQGLRDLSNHFENFCNDVGNNGDSYQREQIENARTLANSSP